MKKASFLRKMAEAENKLKEIAVSVEDQARKAMDSEAAQYFKEKSKAAWAWSTVTASELSGQIAGTDWFDSLNTFKSEVSKAMDEKYLQFGPGFYDIANNVKMSANNHRILDGGHTFFESISRAWDVGEKNGWSADETFKQWAAAYFTDLSSPAGMPMFGDLTDDIYSFLRNTLKIDEAQARDFVTLDGQEALESLIGGTIAAVGIFFAWKSQDKENFSKSISALLIGGAVSLNPVTLVIAVVALALGYNTLVCKKAMARGGFITGTSLAISALIPGPVILGLIPAIVVAVYLSKKMGKDFDLIDFGKKAYQYLKSDEFKDRVDKIILTVSEIKQDFRKAT